jgi:hypothetical protein
MKLFGSSFARTPKPRSFHYQRRFSDGEEEKGNHQKGGSFEFRSSSKVLNRKVSSRQRRRGMSWSQQTGQKRARGRNRMMLLLAIFGVLFAYYRFDLNGILAIFLVFILLVLFIRENNRA